MQKDKKPTVLLAFANDVDDYLPNINEERKTLFDILDDKIHTRKSESVTVDDLIEECDKHENIVILHYGGHAGSDYLLFENSEHTTKANINDLIHIIKKQQNLQLVFLNGCATSEQVAVLLEAGIKAVIATQVGISDKTALVFATRFYKSLADGQNLQTAFEAAKNKVCTELGLSQNHIGMQRGFVFETEEEQFPWRLYYHQETVLDWALPKRRAGKYLSALPNFNLDKFVGREKPLKDLHQNLQNNRATLLLNGLGGIGKTTLAHKYCAEYQDNYDYLVWISQTDAFENALLNAFQLHNALEIQLTDNIEQTIRTIFSRLQQYEGNNLFIIDNADQSLKPYVEYLPPTWKTLVTSREKMDDRFTEQRLDVLNFTEAKALFAQYFTKNTFTDEALKTLCEEVGYHTLTLELLAKTLQESLELQTIAELTTYLKNNRLDDEDLQETIFTNHSQSEVVIYTHLLHALTLAHLGEEEKWLLLQFAVLPPIPHKGKDILQWIQPNKKTKENFFKRIFNTVFKKKEIVNYNQILKTLHKKGWLDRINDTFFMHRMIQTLIRYQIKPTYEKCQGLVNSIDELVAYENNEKNPIAIFDWIEYAVALCNNITDNFEKIGNLNNHTAKAFEERGNYDEAEKYYKQAITIAEALQDQNGVNSYHNNLANVYCYLGRYSEASTLLESVLQSSINNFGKNHPNVAIHQSNLANVYRNLGRYSEASTLLESALQSAIDNFGENHPNIAIYQSNLANVYQDLGRYSEAANLLESALQSAINNFGENHSTIAIYQSNLATVYRNLGRYGEAATLLESALQSDMNNFGEKHPEVAKKQSNLANVYGNLGRYSEAATLLESALQSDINNFEENHTNVATSQSNLALVYKDLGRYSEAATLLESALQSNIKNFVKNHPEVAKKQANLALVYQNLGKYEEAVNLLETALKSTKNSNRDKHPDNAMIIWSLASSYYLLKDYQKAVINYSKAYQIFFTTFGDNHPYTKRCKMDLDDIIEMVRE